MMQQQVIRVTKEFIFDMAHALFGYDGPCKNIHGHTYRLMVTLKGKAIIDADHPKNGMLIDFGILKKIVQEKIIDRFDHALVLNTQIGLRKKQKLTNISEKILYVPYQPTCENLLLDITHTLKPFLNTSFFSLVVVKLYETPTSYAEWHASDN